MTAGAEWEEKAADLRNWVSDDARFFEGRDRSVEQYNKLIRVRAAKRDLRGAYEAFQDMRSRDIVPNALTWNALLKVLLIFLFSLKGGGVLI